MLIGFTSGVQSVQMEIADPGCSAEQLRSDAAGIVSALRPECSAGDVEEMEAFLLRLQDYAKQGQIAAQQ